MELPYHKENAVFDMAKSHQKRVFGEYNSFGEIRHFLQKNKEVVRYIGRLPI